MVVKNKGRLVIESQNKKFEFERKSRVSGVEIATYAMHGP